MMRSIKPFLPTSLLPHVQRGWFKLAMVALPTVVVWMLVSKDRNREEWTWQLPIEPPGVTIISQPPQAGGSRADKTALAKAPSKPTSDAIDRAAKAPSAVQTPMGADDRATADAEVRQTIERWSMAWRSRDMAGYLEQYAKSFVPSGDQSRAAWVKSRYHRILSKKLISHEVRQLEVSFTGDTATAQFEQIYAADQMRQVGPKTLRFRREGAQWRIISESSN